MSDAKANVDSYIERLKKPAGVPPFIQREVAMIMQHQQAEIERLRERLESEYAKGDKLAQDTVNQQTEIERLRDLELKQTREIHALLKSMRIAIDHVRNTRWESALAELEGFFVAPEGEGE